MTRDLRCPAYLRYVDDFLLFANDRPTLWRWRDAIMERLARLRLTIHKHKAQARPVTEGIPFLGFIVYPTHRLLKQRKGIAYRRKLTVLLEAYRQGKVEQKDVKISVESWVNHARYGDTWGLRRAILRAARL